MSLSVFTAHAPDLMLQMSQDEDSWSPWGSQHRWRGLSLVSQSLCMMAVLFTEGVSDIK